MKRYALLDTDFISKTHSVQDDGGNHLIDRVMELPEYSCPVSRSYKITVSDVETQIRSFFRIVRGRWFSR